MASQTTPSGRKTMTWVFDGTQSRFVLLLNNRIAPSSEIRLVQYTVQDPTSPIISFYPTGARGLTFLDTTSNVIQPGGFSIASSGTSENVAYSPGKLIGFSQSAELREFEVKIRDVANMEHNPVSNKLFDWVILEFLIVENAAPRNPDYLQQVPAIQQTLDTV